MHDDVPCKRYDDEQEREGIGIALTNRICEKVHGYENVSVKSELFEMPLFIPGVSYKMVVTDKDAAEMC